MGLLGSDTPNVTKLAKRGKLDSLRAALRYEQIVVDEDGREWDSGYQVRVQAVHALSQFDAASVAPDLSAALDDRVPAVRAAAVEAIGRLKIRVAGVLEQLLECVVSRRPDSAEVTARALDVLVDWHAHGTAELLVERLLAPDAPDLDDQHREAVERLVGADPRGARAYDALTERVLDQLRQSNRDRREAHAETILGWLGTSALEKVLDALDNGAAAPGLVRAAGMLGDARAVGPVVRTLESDDPAMRTAAADAARTLNHTRAVPALLTATQDDEQAVRDAASAALDRMGTAAVIAGLAAVVSARGLLAAQGTELDGDAEDDELSEASGDRELEEAQVEEPAPRAAEPAPVQPTQPAQPTQPVQPGPASHPAPAYPPYGRRRGGFIERLLGREY